MSTPSSSLAKYAFNIYGNIHPHDPSPPSARPRNPGLHFHCEREVTSLSQISRAGDIGDAVVVAGKNYLKLLVVGDDQSKITREIDVLESSASFSRVPQPPKLNNISTVKASGDLIACGNSNGALSVYRVGPSGRARLVHKVVDHKRTINSLDIVGDEPHHVISGSQDGAVKLWDLRTPSARPVLSIMPSSHSDPVRSCQHSPHMAVRNKLVILSAHDSGSLCKFDVRAVGASIGGSSIGPERRWNVHAGPALSLHVHPRLEYVVTGGRDQKMCISNYSEAASASAGRSLQSEHVISTYGPVMKVRWSHYGDDDGSLASHDVACSYLNDDPTISVFSLSRKFIPREVVTMRSHKPVQNFIWPANFNHRRRIWSLTKANEFISCDLDTASAEVARPLASLTSVAVDFSPGGDIGFVNQEKYASEADDSESDYSEADASDRSPDGSSPFLNHPMPMKAAPHPLFGSPVTPSPDKQRGPSPRRVSGERPKFVTHGSSSTTESVASVKERRFLDVAYNNPYVVPLALPLPLNDTTVFAHLAAHTLLAPPDGFNLIDVCEINAGIAAAVHRYRDCQMWRVLAGALAREDSVDMVAGGGGVYGQMYHSEDAMEVFSESEAPFGSYNSNSTANTNYGGSALATDHITSSESLVPKHHRSSFASSSPVKWTRRFDEDDGSPRPGSPGKLAAGLAMTRATGSSPTLGSANLGFRNESPGKEGVTSPVATPQLPHPGGHASSSLSSSQMHHPTHPLATSPLTVVNHTASHPPGNRDGHPIGVRQGTVSSTDLALPPVDEDAPVVDPRAPRRSFTHQRRPLLRTYTTMEDLDNENLNLATSVPSSLPRISPRQWQPPSPQHRHSVTSRESWASRRNSSMVPGIHRSNSGHQSLEFGLSKPHLNDVAEEYASVTSMGVASELTRGLGLASETPPWTAPRLLRQSLDYAQLQGDLVVAASLVLLFYPVFPAAIRRDEALNILALYVEQLRRHTLFVEASYVVKLAPPELAESLAKVMPHDTSLRFFCEHCGKVLINERSKARVNEGAPVDFGFWYCDACSRRQSNCIYCCEPCKGMAVVVSLKCGHRGHPRCMKEWFVTGGNVDCPGGCDFAVA
ncbi:restriction of telomere capping protein 1 [Diutina catenulata]